MENFRNSIVNQMPKVQPTLAKRSSLPISTPIHNDYGLNKNAFVKGKDNFIQNDSFKNFNNSDYANFNVNAHLYVNPYHKNISPIQADNFKKQNNPFTN